MREAYWERWTNRPGVAVVRQRTKEKWLSLPFICSSNRVKRFRSMCTYSLPLLNRLDVMNTNPIHSLAFVSIYSMSLWEEGTPHSHANSSMYGSLSVVPNEDGKLATVLTRMQIHGLQRIENCCKIRGKIAQTQLVLNRLGYYFYYWRTCSFAHFMSSKIQSRLICNVYIIRSLFNSTNT